jgi:hypothetical protein
VTAPLEPAVVVTIDGETKFSSAHVTGYSIERYYDGWGHTTTITIHHDAPSETEAKQ